MIEKEWKSIFKNKVLILSFIGVMFIPIIYCGMFITAFWNPYGHLDQLPIAVVNLDKGAVLKGKHIAIGNDLIQKMKDDKKFNWSFVDEKTAKDGLKNHQYYAMVEIPENFSFDASTVMDNKPKKMQINYIPNEGMNYIATKITDSAMEKLKEGVQESVTAEYSETIFDNIQKIKNGMQQASDGANKLDSSIADAKDGTEKIKKGSNDLYNGESQLLEQIKFNSPNIKSLSDGANQANQSAKSLSDGLMQLKSASSQLSLSSQQVLDGMKSLQSNSGAFTSGMNSEDQGIESLQALITQFQSEHPELSNDPLLLQIEETSQTLKTNMDALNQSQTQIKVAIDQTTEGQSQLTAGIEGFDSQFANANSGSQLLNRGVSQLAIGTLNAYNGWNQLEAGVTQLKTGSSELSQGTSSLNDGMQKLKDGSYELSQKLKDGTEQTKDIKQNEQTNQMIAEPVVLNETKRLPVDSYGTGFAPYFLSLGLFMGMIVLTIVYSMREPIEKPKNAWTWFSSKFITIASIGFIQALIADFILIKLIGVEVKEIWLFVLLSMISSLAFSTLVQFLVTTLDNIGRFIAIILLTLQLTTNGGTYPIELITKFFHPLQKWLPMTYSVEGFKVAVVGDDTSFYWKDFGVLLLFVFLSTVGTIIYMYFKTRVSKQKNVSKK